MTSSYFSLLPNIEYDTKPVTYPFSEQDFVVAKNFFKRFRVSKDLFEDTTLFKLVFLTEDFTRLEQVARDVYGRPDYDWVIAITNQMVNPLFDFPLSTEQLRTQVEKSYENPFSTIRHYEIISNQEQEDAYGRVLLDEGTHVDQSFYNSSVKYWDGTQTVSVSGSSISFPVTEFEYEYNLNEKKRQIYILYPRFVTDFVDEFRRQAKYKKSSTFVSTRLKQSGK